MCGCVFKVKCNTNDVLNIYLSKLLTEHFQILLFQLFVILYRKQMARCRNINCAREIIAKFTLVHRTVAKSVVLLKLHVHF